MRKNIPKPQPSNANNPGSLNIVSWNTNTLSKNDILTLIYGSLHGHSPDVICFQETRLTKADSDDFNLNGFDIFASPASSTSPREGENRGLLTAVRSTILAKESLDSDQVRVGSGVETLSTRIKTTEGWVNVHNIYVHQDSNLRDLNLDLPKSRHILVGDFNSRHPDWEPLSPSALPAIIKGNSKQRGDILHSAIQNDPNLILINANHTATTPNNTTLTLSLVSSNLAVGTDWEVLHDCSTEPHFATMITVQLSPPTHTTEFKPRFISERADWDKFKQVSSEDVPSVDGSGHLEDSFETLTKVLMKSANIAIPVTKKHDKIAPWECWFFNEKCKEAKAKLHKASQDNKKQIPGARAILRKIRQETLSVFSQAKHEKWNSICRSLNLSSSLSSHWRRLRWIYNGGTPPQKSLIENAKAVANESMAFFSERSMSSNLRIPTRLVQSHLNKKRSLAMRERLTLTDTELDKPFDLCELNKALENHKDSSPGEDQITYSMLHFMGDPAKLLLLNLVNSSFDQERLASQWKTVPHIPVPKSTPGEFRPIALLSCVEKVMERMILARLKFRVGPLHVNLMGCIQGKGTMDAIATLAKLASDANHRRSGPINLALKACYAIFLDYEKAFEMADPTTILHILSADKGVTGKVLGWIKDFLTNRKGFAYVQGERSDIFPLFNGTPQGSVLSPYLFNILMDKLLNVLDESLGPDLNRKLTVISYADDILLVSNHFAAPMILKKALGHLEMASTSLGLQISVSKTKAMAWTHSQFLPSFDFKVYNGNVEWVRQFKYLGVIFDDNLSFLLHAHHLRSRAEKRVNVLKHLAGSPYGATQDTLLHYFKSCIRPILEYGSIIFPIACPSAIRLLESVQNIALRIALRVPQNTRTVLVLAEAGVTSIDDRSKSLALVAWSKINAFLNHPLTNQNEMHPSIDMLPKVPKSDRDLPLDIALNNLKDSYMIPKLDPPMLKLFHPKQKNSSSDIHFDIKSLPKAKNDLTADELIALKENLCKYIEDHYKGFKHFYIDGSVDPDTGRAAAAFIQSHSPPVLSKSVRLTDQISSTQAELGALSILFEYLKVVCEEGERIVVHCDSMPALLTLKGDSPKDIFCKQKYNILEILHHLISKMNLGIHLHWIPSHIGIPGNEQVDDTVKGALNNTIIDVVIPTSVGQIKAVIRKAQKNKQHLLFNQMAVESPNTRSAAQIRHYKCSNPTLKPQNRSNLLPAIQRSLNHLRLDSDSWCFEHNTKNKCFYCHLDFSTHHYLIECPVSASPHFLEELTLEEHSLYPVYQAPIILNKITRKDMPKRIVTHFNKYPVRAVCPFPEHGDLQHAWINIPKGL